MDIYCLLTYNPKTAKTLHFIQYYLNINHIIFSYIIAPSNPKIVKTLNFIQYYLNINHKLIKLEIKLS